MILHNKKNVVYRSIVPALLVGIVMISVGILGGFYTGSDEVSRVSPEADLSATPTTDTTLRIVHTGRGDLFTSENTERLVVTVNGEAISEIELPFGPNDSITIDSLETGDRVEVVWHSPNSAQKDPIVVYVFQNRTPTANISNFINSHRMIANGSIHPTGSP